MKRRTHNWDAEFDIINGTGTDQQQQLVDAFSQALSGETPLTGEDSGWTQIGGIKLGTKVIIKDEQGTGLFELEIRALPGVAQDFDINSNFPVLLKRDEEGAVERVSIDFTREMQYSGLSNQNLSPEQTTQVMEKLAQWGCAKPKGGKA